MTNQAGAGERTPNGMREASMREASMREASMREAICPRCLRELLDAQR